MYSILLIIIYIAFISLGLPDSLLGSGWPVMYKQLQVPMSYAGIVTMIIAGGIIISSLMSDRLTKRFGVGTVTTISVMMTSVALFGFSISNSFIFLCLWAIPYGLGAGAVDAALNNYVALYYTSKHMSWLHCFWGVGASISPYIMSYCLLGGYGWHSGYRAVAIVQIILTSILFITLPLWKEKNVTPSKSENMTRCLSFLETVNIKGVKLMLLAFFAYCSLETTTGLWASSYLVSCRDIKPEMAAQFTSMFFLGITFGRFACGFIANKMGDKRLIRMGILVIICGIILLIFPWRTNITVLMGLIIIGLGCSPIYPSIIHSTPVNFGAENSQAIIGIQMASAYMGSTFMPPIFGWIAEDKNIGIFPFYIAFFALLMFTMSEALNMTIVKKKYIK